MRAVLLFGLRACGVLSPPCLPKISVPVRVRHFISYVRGNAASYVEFLETKGSAEIKDLFTRLLTNRIGVQLLPFLDEKEILARMDNYRLWFLLVCSLLCLNATSITLNAQTAEPCEHSSLSIVGSGNSRPSVEGDYLVIEYNARSLQTFWYDYHHPNRTPMAIDRNGSFIPVVYTKEKVAVHVCNLHFGDLLTVTTSPLGTPEGGADIRGTTPAAIPALGLLAV